MDTRKALLIRDARVDERDLQRELTLAAYAEYAQKMPTPRWQELQQIALAALGQGGPVERIVAEQDGVLVGGVLLFPPAGTEYGGYTGRIDWPEVRLLAVLPSARGQGVGAALMEECAWRARRMGATSLGLHTSDDMVTAKRMYERMGFQRVPAFDFRPRDGHLVMAYRRELGEGPPFLSQENVAIGS